MQPEIRLTKISKSYSGVPALRNVSLDIYAGEVHALVGENGAGKSTLMKILSGAISAGDFEGEILLRGQVQKFLSPLDAEKAGIAIIHQELSSLPDLTVAENLFVGHWPRKFAGLIDWEKMNALATKALERVGANFSPTTKMQSLSTGDQQMVEIAKALLRDTKILILDEPTSSLSTKECERLFSLIAELKNEGRAMIYISHRMEEIFSLSDRITVLRDGSSVHTAKSKELTEPLLITHMVGRSLQALYPVRAPMNLGDEVLRLVNFIAIDKQNGRTIGPINLSVKKGEVLGLGGLLGAGRSEFLRALLGDERYSISGEVFWHGKKFNPQNPRQSYSAGLAWLAEDRKRESILPVRSLLENAGILRINQKGLFSYVSHSAEEEKTQSSLQQLKTRFHHHSQKITELSGGNQQKVILARILQSAPDLLILDEPTRGVDVGAKFEIYELLYSLIQQNKAIILISSDLPELLAMSDRAIVLANGRMRGELPKEKFSQESIMQLAVQK